MANYKQSIIFAFLCFSMAETASLCRDSPEICQQIAIGGSMVSDNILRHLLDKMNAYDLREKENQVKLEDMEARLKSLQNYVTFIESENNKDKHRQNTDIIKNNKIEEENTNIRTNTLQEMDNVMSHRRTAGTGQVAFFATLRKDTRQLTRFQNIIFDHVVTNVGHAYREHLGSFIAPVAGIYVFSTSLTTYAMSESHYGIALNGHIQNKFHLTGKDNFGDDTTTDIILELQVGDEVTVQHVEDQGGLYSDDHSIFSGFLLNP